MKRGKTILVLIQLVFVVGCGQSQQVEVTHKSDPPGEMWHEQYGLRVIPEETVGSFVQVEECHKKRIILKQVDCGDIGKNAQGDWPCYKDCERIRIRASLDVRLGLKKAKIGPVLCKWEAFFTADPIVRADSGWNEMVVCVEAWRAKLYERRTAGNAAKIGELIITVKPRV